MRVSLKAPVSEEKALIWETTHPLCDPRNPKSPTKVSRATGRELQCGSRLNSTHLPPYERTAKSFQVMAWTKLFLVWTCYSFLQLNKKGLKWGEVACSPWDKRFMWDWKTTGYFRAHTVCSPEIHSSRCILLSKKCPLPTQASEALAMPALSMALPCAVFYVNNQEALIFPARSSSFSIFLLKLQTKPRNFVFCHPQIHVPLIPLNDHILHRTRTGMLSLY